MESSIGIESLRDMFRESEEAGVDARLTSHKCRDYYDGKQWTPEEAAALQKRKQAPIVINRVRRKVDWLRGLEMQSRTDPKAFPRTPNHEQEASSATDALRFVAENTDWDKKRSKIWENILVEGLGGVEIVHENNNRGEPEIVLNYYSFDRLFYDPHSKEEDFSDARYKGAVIWSDTDSLKAQYPGKEDIIDGSIRREDSIDDTFDDKPSRFVWSDPRRKRVVCVLVYYNRGGEWNWAKFVFGGILEQGASPYRDEDGQSLCPLIMQSAYVDRDNQRYGIVKDMLDPQDEINKRRSKLLHSLNTRQTAAQKGAIKAATVKAEMAKPDGHIEYDVVDPNSTRAPFEVLSNQDQTAGQFQLLQEAKSEIDLMGANSGLAGKGESESQSGRAILARQQGGMIEIAPLTDGLSQFTRAVYRQIWALVRQLWTEERWLRVTDDERNMKFVGINRPVTLKEELEGMQPEEVQAIARRINLVPNDPRLQMVVRTKNSVAKMDVDIMLEEVPDQVTLQGETFEQLVNLATSMPGSVPPAILIEAAPNLKKDIKDKLIEMLEGQSQSQAQAAEAQAQSEQQKAEADMALSLARASKEQAAAQKQHMENSALEGEALALLETA